MCVNPNPEIRVPKEIRNPKTERAHRTRQLRASAFGLLSDFGNSDLGFGVATELEGRVTRVPDRFRAKDEMTSGGIIP